MTTSTFYHAFEAAFRGSREQIIERLQGYNPFLEPLSQSGLPKVALDLGCGRGEWLETLGQFEFNAHGVDLDEGMLADCRAAGLSCEHQDALSALASSKDESLGVLSAFHMIEHLPFESVRTIITDGLRALAPGGLLILETPNPENIEVGTVTFHNDSTHVAPIPPNVLKFLAEHAGYSKIKLLRLNELPLENSRVVGLSDVLFGASPDYALVAQKAGPDDLMAATGAAFAAETGPSTRDLASAFEETQEHAFDELRHEIETLRTRLKAHEAKLSAQDEKIAKLKKTKKTRLYYKSRLIRNLDGQIKSWLSRRREIGRVKAAAVRRASAKNVPQIDRTRKWHTVSLSETLHWRLEGPFDSSYSLALVNRELARGLQRQGVRVQLKSSEGPGDFEPDPKFMADNSDLASMHKTKFGRTDTVSRNMYPPRVADLGDALPGLHSYAWEETGFPHDYVASFNDVLRYLTVTSDHVRKVMIDNGVFVPCYTVGNGVDHLEEIDPEPVAGLPENGTLFLHVSSCFPRKGVDALLEAWAQAFTKRDDVTLLIKSFPNPHNTVAEQISELRLEHPDLAPIHLINEDLSDGQMRFLYGSCDIAVFPSRAEGFGLPMAEARVMGKPVLTTGWSGQMDFADLPLVRTIDYRFEQTKSHVGTGLSMWADPDPDHMAELMREAAASPAPSEADSKRTRDLLLDRFNWDEVAKRSIAAIRHAAARPKPIPPRVGWVTTYNSRCGIATYSEHLIRYLRLPVHVLGAHTNNSVEPDDSLSEVITRCWKEGREDAFSDLLSVIRAEDLQTIVIQFNYGFFNFANLAQLIHTLKDEGRQVVITLHATDDTPHPREIQLGSIRDALAKCDRILVHKVLDANRMKALGLVENVTLFPHGVLPMVTAPAPRKLPETEPFKIGSYGFFLPNKGLPELVEAVAHLRNTGRNVQLHLVNAEYPVGESRQLIDAVRGQIDQHDLDDIVKIETDFLSDDAALSRLSKCDLIVFGYQRSSESASGAVRYGLISGRPVAVTPLEIFSDVSQYSIALPGTSPAEMADGIDGIIDRMRGDDGPSLDPELQDVLDRSRMYCTDRSYAVLGTRLKGMLTALSDDQVNGFT
jgi:glycosyltransferase involved in cell wall biosynthesis/SAM-dependent methyltransferase